MFDGARLMQFHVNELKPQKASATDLSERSDDNGAPFLGRKFKPEIEDGIEVGVERRKSSEHIHQDSRTMNPITVYS